MTVRFTETFCSCLKLSLLSLATPRAQSQYSISPEKNGLHFRHIQLGWLQSHPSATTKARSHHHVRPHTRGHCLFLCCMGQHIKSGSDPAVGVLCGRGVVAQPKSSLRAPCSDWKIRAKGSEQTAGGCRQMGEAGAKRETTAISISSSSVSSPAALPIACLPDFQQLRSNLPKSIVSG